MAFKDYHYGIWKKEIRKLLQKRISIIDKIRYHRLKVKSFEKNDLPKIEEELNQLLIKAGNKI